MPVLEWLDRMPGKAQDKCLVGIERLEEMGHELRRPQADYLRDGIYELRVRHQRVHYRLLYFFHEGRAVVTNGLTKEGVVSPREIELARRRKAMFEQNPDQHTHGE